MHISLITIKALRSVVVYITKKSKSCTLVVCLPFGVSAADVSVAVVAVAQLLPCPLLLPCSPRHGSLRPGSPLPCVDSGSSRDRRRTRGPQPQLRGRIYAVCSPESSENTEMTWTAELHYLIYTVFFGGWPLGVCWEVVHLAMVRWAVFDELRSDEPHPMFSSTFLTSISLLDF